MRPLAYVKRSLQGGKQGGAPDLGGSLRQAGVWVRRVVAGWELGLGGCREALSFNTDRKVLKATRIAPSGAPDHLGALESDLRLSVATSIVLHHPRSTMC
jgi:hypothetical protein